MAQEKDDFKRLSEKYENELMNYYRAHAPTVLSYSGNTRSIEPSEFERDRVSEHRIGNETNVSELSENEAAAGEQREDIVHLEEENIPPENSPLADEPTLPMSPLPNGYGFYQGRRLDRTAGSSSAGLQSHDFKRRKRNRLLCRIRNGYFGQ